MSLEPQMLSKGVSEVIGAIVCSLTFSFFWTLDQASGSSFYYELAWNIFLSAGCYLSVYYILERYRPWRQWSFRPNWIALSLGGTTLTFLFVCLTTLLEEFRRSPYSSQYLVSASLEALAGLNIFMLPVMGGIYFVGFGYRLLRRGLCGDGERNIGNGT